MLNFLVQLFRLKNNRVPVMFPAVMLLVNLAAFGQVRGDEDKEMYNTAKKRDEKAIQEARKGWWASSVKTQNKRIQWWREARFGMFIHWGLYSLPGGEWKGKVVPGYSEHLMRKEKISRAEYLQLASQFNPEKFNADEWIMAAKKAGMRYFVVTAKHHDGFAMYDSKVSDFNIVQQTLFKRDPMAELAASAKKHGMKFGFYYSHAFDWEHPGAPGNDWEYNNPGGDKLLGGGNWFDTHPEWLPKAIKYVDEKAIPQIRELINKYHPDILWFDTPHKLPLSENLRILKAVRETDPNIVVNGRLAAVSGENFGDYINTNDNPVELFTIAGDAEAIPTTNHSYGYSKHDKGHKSPQFFIRLLANAASRGGNLLMNIGPKGDGSFDSKDSQILDGIGQWLNKNGEAIYGTQRGQLPIPAWGVTTQNGNRIYLHVFNKPADGNLILAGLKNKVNRAYFLTDKRKAKLPVQYIDSAAISIALPQTMVDDPDRVIVLEVKGKIETDAARLLLPNISVNRFLAFDAEKHGKFGNGSGQNNQYYLTNWQNKQDYLTWNIRALKPQKYSVILKYVADEGGSSFELEIGDFIKTVNVETSAKKGAVITREIGDVEVRLGAQAISIKPVHIKGAELMKPLEIQLIPLN